MERRGGAPPPPTLPGSQMILPYISLVNQLKMENLTKGWHVPPLPSNLDHLSKMVFDSLSKTKELLRVKSQRERKQMKIEKKWTEVGGRWHFSPQNRLLPPASANFRQLPKKTSPVDFSP